MILCFDIGGTSLKTAQSDHPGHIIATGRSPTPKASYPDFVSTLRNEIKAAARPPKALAFSIAGVLDPQTGAAAMANIPCLNGVILRQQLEDDLQLPLVLANDADCFTVAEARLGAGQGKHVTLGVILGTGIGGGLVIAGDLINKNGGFSGEWGHGAVVGAQINGRTLPELPCGCGRRGCLEAYCAARGLEKLHHFFHPDQTLTTVDLLQAWQEGAPSAQDTMGTWLDLMTGPLSMIQNLLAADVVVVGGGLGNCTPLITALDKRVRAQVLQHVSQPLIRPAQCQIDYQIEAGLIGAALLGHDLIPIL